MEDRAARIIGLAVVGALACSSGAKNPVDASGVAGASGGAPGNGGRGGAGGTGGGGAGGGVSGTSGSGGATGTGARAGAGAGVSGLGGASSAGAAGTGGGGGRGGAGGRGGNGGSGGTRTCGAPAPHNLTFSTQRVKALPAGIVPSGFALPAANPPAIIYYGANQAGDSNQVWATTIPQPAGDGGVTTTTGTRLSRGSNAGVTIAPASVSRARDGSARIAYVEQNIAIRVRYVEWSGDVNQNPVDVQADGADGINHRPMISLDANDRPSIVFLDINSMLHFAQRPQTTWSGEMLTTGAVTVGGGYDGVVDGAGTAVVVATAQLGAAAGVTASVRTASGWTKQPVDGDAMDVGPRAAVDPMGRAVVMWGTQAGLGLAVRDGDTWSVTSPLMDSSGNVFGGGPSSAFDFAFGADGQIRVAFGDSRIDYAYSDGCFWYQQNIEPQFVSRAGPALAVDAAGNVHVAYFDKVANELWYAHGVP
jgi:hypothetical protein